MYIRLLSNKFEIIELPGIEICKFGNGLVIDHFDLTELKIYLNKDLPVQMRKYGLFHAIWEILLKLLGQYYNHEGFQGFSYIFYSTLLENQLLCLLSRKDQEYFIDRQTSTTQT